MNKEAIERTKARCKKEKYDHVWSGEYQSGEAKPLRISRSNGCKAINQKEVGLIVPRADYIPEINAWIPLNRQELYIFLGVATGLIMLGVYFL